MYQLARLHLSTGAVSTETIVGFRYSSEAATLAEEALKKALSSTPDYPEAHALSGLLYAAQNRLPESAASFAAAEKAYVSPVWLDFNKAVLAVQMKEYEDAADLLKQLTAVHPNKKNKIAGKIYQSAWRLLRRLAVEHPELDPVRGIRNGHIKRVLAEDYADYLAQHKGSDKPLYVHFASSDNWCSPCAVNLKRVNSLARQHGDKFDFIHVSFEPWRSVSQYMSMLPKSIRALPYQVFISHGVEQASQYGAMTEQSIRTLVTKHYDDLQAGRLAGKVATEVENKALQRISASFHKHLKNASHYRAFTVALEDSRWVAGSSDKQLSQTSANAAALKSCERKKAKAKRKLQADCQLYAVDETVVFGFTDAEIAAATKAAQKADGPVETVLSRYHSKSAPKAFAFSRSDEGHWVSYFAYESDSLAKARTRALEECDAKRRRRDFDKPCELYWQNDEPLQPLPLD